MACTTEPNRTEYFIEHLILLSYNFYIELVATKFFLTIIDFLIFFDQI